MWERWGQNGYGNRNYFHLDVAGANGGNRNLEERRRVLTMWSSTAD